MGIRIFAVALCLGLCAGMPSLADEVEGWTGPLEALGITGALDQLAEPKPWTVKQVSSYDRTGGNDDDRDGHQVYEGGVLLCDIEGPGVISRIWTRTPQGTLYIYVDDIEHPIITLPLESFFGGDLELHSPGFNLFSPPFTGEAAGGYFSYVPIPFEKHCRMIVTGQDDVFAYQITYLDLPEDTPLKSYELALSKDDVEFFRDWRDNWRSTDFRYHDRETEKIHNSRHKYWPESNTQVYPIEGPGTITEIEVRVESALPEIMDNTWIAVFFDGQSKPGVFAPLGDFFGAATKDVDDYDSLVVGRIDGRMWCRYPMPFHEFAEVRFINLSEQIADIEYYITWQPGEVEDQRYFFARYKEAVSKSGEPYVPAEISGEGHYVGTTISATNADSLTFLEGDDVYLVDGDDASSFHGTGTDDYFNGGWYFATGTGYGPLSAATLKESKAPTGFAAYRGHVTDAVPFRNSFRFELEHGPANDRAGVQYSSVAYWYQAAMEPELWSLGKADKWGYRR